MAYSTPSLGSQGPTGEGDYTVEDGDCIDSIAFERGFLWSTIWNHPQNADLKKARVSPNVLLPGDQVHIPEKVLKDVDRPCEQRHRFVLKGRPCKLRVCVKRNGEPQCEVDYRLTIDGTISNGKTDSDGWIEVVIPPNARSGQLKIGDNPLHQQVFDLDLGGMDPVTEAAGVQKRLHNLGYDCDPTGMMDEPTAAAIAQFQTGEGLDPTGELDQTTIDKLKTRHGS